MKSSSKLDIDTLLAVLSDIYSLISIMLVTVSEIVQPASFEVDSLYVPVPPYGSSSVHVLSLPPTSLYVHTVCPDITSALTAALFIDTVPPGYDAVPEVVPVVRSL